MTLGDDHILTFKTGDYINQFENINIFQYPAIGEEEEHTHDFIEIVYIISGKGQQVINGTRYDVERGDLLFINIGQTHSFQSYGTMEIVNCLITPEFIDRELLHSENAFELLALSYFEEFEDKIDKLVPMISFRGKELIEIESLITSMIAEFVHKPINFRTALRGYVLVLLTKIFRQMQQQEMGHILHQVNKLTPDLLRYIEEHCFEKITLNTLAQKCFYNPSYFSKIFKEVYGKNLMEYIHEKRIQEALRLLKETNLSIENISLRVGYNDRKQFYKILKAHTGLTPKEARDGFQKTTTDMQK
jgi:AraC family L-rhamnose operon transcriptional activator RhaR